MDPNGDPVAVSWGGVDSIPEAIWLECLPKDPLLVTLRALLCHC